eukprot:Em0003g189a
MPAKKGGNTDIGGTSNARGEHASISPPLSESSDPVVQAVGIVDRKVRNLEKRKAKLESLQQLRNEGKELDRDQLDAVSKLGEVLLQLELAKELQKQFVTFNDSYQKTKKKQQKAEKQQQREAERDLQKSALAYSVRVQNLLAGLDEVSKPDFRKGTNGAVQLTEDELTQLDDLYQLLVPTRISNADYQREVELVGEHFLLLQEQSTKDVAGTTYKDLYNLLQKLDGCSYFDSSHNEDDGLSLGGGEESAEDGMAEEEVAAACEEEEAEVPTPQEPQPPPQSIVEQVVTQPCTQVQVQAPPQGVIAPLPPAPQVVLQQHTPSLAPSVPSPTFPALAVVSGGLANTEEMFSFMHKSEVSTQVIFNNDPQQISSNKALAPQDNTSGPSTTTTDTRGTEGKSTTDASTGQLSPTLEGENPNAFQQQGGRYNRGGTSYRSQGSQQYRGRNGGPRGGGGGGSGYRNGGGGRSYASQGTYGGQQSYSNRGPPKGEGKGTGYQGGPAKGNGYPAQRENGYPSGGRGRSNYNDR